jgi:hypothetical protein
MALFSSRYLFTFTFLPSICRVSQKIEIQGGA